MTMLSFDASWAPLVALAVGFVAVIMILNVIAVVYGQALERYMLICSARDLRNSHIRKLREIDAAAQREMKMRAEKMDHRATVLHSAPPVAPGVEGAVDILEAA